MKKLSIYAFAFITLAISACNGTSKTGSNGADSGAAGNSGATDSSVMSAGSGSPTPVGTSGTDTSTNGKGVANPTADTVKNNPK